MCAQRSARHIPLTVTNTTKAARRSAPVTSGVPLKQGMIHKADDLRLLDASGNSVPLQWQPLALWPDGSVKWALLDFQASVPAEDEALFTLKKGSPPKHPGPVKVSRKGDAVTINTGALRISLDCAKPGLIDGIWLHDTGSGWTEVATQLDASMRTAKGEFVASRSKMSVAVERRGPMRATVALKGEHLNSKGTRCFSFVLRIHAFAGLPYLKLEYMFLNDNPTGVFTKVREVKLDLQLATEQVQQLHIGGFDPATPKGDVRLFQKDDRRCALEGLGRKRVGDKAPGWITVEGQAGAVTGVVRDFWQQWPKSLEASADRVSFGLLPALGEGEYDGLEPLDKHYYLFKNQDYLIKTGVAKRHELWLTFGDGSEVAAGSRSYDDVGGNIAAAVNAPLIAVADPQWVAASGALGEMTPAGHPIAADYDRVALHNAEVYQQTTIVERQYGLLNWGDWFGERTYNWGNHEYDTAHAFCLLFARTGDAQHFYEAERAAKHQADVDVLHAINDDYLNSGEIGGYSFPVGVGAMYLHAVGHVGGYWPLKQGAKMFPKAYSSADPRNLGHLWNEGLFETYYFTGDPWVREAALQLADYLVSLAAIKDFTWWFGRDPHCGRTAGWPLHALMAAYHATGKRKYLRASKRIVELALADQDSHCGGWIYQLYPGHCFCEEGHRHMGMAVFITGVLLAGMIEYHKVTGDARVADSIVRAVDFIIADAWDEIEGRFHYTSCPASSLTTPMRVLWPMAYAVRLAGKPRHIHVLRRAWDTYIRDREQASVGRGFGKSFASAHRSASQALPILAELDEGGIPAQER